MLEDKIQHLAKLYMTRDATPREIKEWAGELVESGLHDENLIEAAYASEESYDDLRVPMDRFIANLDQNGLSNVPIHPTKGVQEPIQFQPDGSTASAGNGKLPAPATPTPHTSTPENIAFSPSIPVEGQEGSALVKKPLGIILLATFSILAGLAEIGNLLYGFWSIQDFEILNRTAILLEDKNLTMTKILLHFSVGAGLLAGFTWSWWIYSTHVSVIPVMGIYLLVTESPNDGSSWFVWIALLGSTIVLFYLFMPNVQMYFFQTMDLKLKKFRLLLVVASIISAMLIALVLKNPEFHRESGEPPNLPTM